MRVFVDRTRNLRSSYRLSMIWSRLCPCTEGTMLEVMWLYKMLPGTNQCCFRSCRTPPTRDQADTYSYQDTSQPIVAETQGNCLELRCSIEFENIDLLPIILVYCRNKSSTFCCCPSFLLLEPRGALEAVAFLLRPVDSNTFLGKTI